MSHFDRPGATLPDPVKQRPRPSRFGNIGDRLARTFGGYDREAEQTQDWDPQDDYGYPAEEDETTRWEPVGPRFPLARLGYDRSTVDDHVAELERELADLHSRAPEQGAVTAEIERIGEQTSAILTVAHDKAQEMTRQAQEQADRCLADAASNAVMITEDAKRRLRDLDTDTDAVWRERARLLEDVRSVANSLISLADAATARFPAEPDKSSAADLMPSEPKARAAMAIADAATAREPGSAVETSVKTSDASVAVDPTAAETTAMPPVSADDRHERESNSDSGPQTEQHWFGS
jgi:cell division septum initiation protein DivIVA